MVSNTVTPFAMLFAPAQLVWPPLRMANFCPADTRAFSAVETSCAERGLTIQAGPSFASLHQYESSRPA